MENLNILQKGKGGEALSFSKVFICRTKWTKYTIFLLVLQNVLLWSQQIKKIKNGDKNLYFFREWILTATEVCKKLKAGILNFLAHIWEGWGLLSSCSYILMFSCCNFVSICPSSCHHTVIWSCPHVAIVVSSWCSKFMSCHEHHVVI